MLHCVSVLRIVNVTSFNLVFSGIDCNEVLLKKQQETMQQCVFDK